jgi:hypothetical protein
VKVVVEVVCLLKRLLKLGAKKTRLCGVVNTSWMVREIEQVAREIEQVPCAWA